MRIPQSGLRIDDPSWPLLEGLISYHGITSANGNAGGTTLVCADLANFPSYDGLTVKIRGTGPANGQARTIQVDAAGVITVGVAFTNAAGAAQQILAGTPFVILSSLVGGGGPGPSPEEGLSYYGIVDAAAAPAFTISALAGLGAGKFDGATNPYYAFVLRDAGGGGLAPQGELQPITAYVNATGAFTAAGFGGGGIGVGDEILILHPSLAGIFTLIADLAVPGIDSLINLLMRDVTGNKADTELFAATNTASIMRYIKASLHAKVIASGTFTTSGVWPRDNARTEGNDYFNGCVLMPIAGVDAFQPRRIIDWVNATKEFQIDLQNPFTAPTGLVAYIVLADFQGNAPPADGGQNVTVGDMIGNKGDTERTTVDNASSLMQYIKGLVNAKTRQLFCMDFWSNPVEEISLTQAAATLPAALAAWDITVADVPAGATIVRAVAMLKFRMVENTNQAFNALDGSTVAATSQVIQVETDAPGTWRDAINFVDHQFSLTASIREGGDVCIGNIDIAVEVTGNDTYHVRWLLSKAHQDNLNFNDVQTGLRIWYSV